MEIRVVLSDEARAFVMQQPLKAQQKITYNIRKVAGGVIDKELFKKLENSEIWEFRTLFNGICYRLFAFWDSRKGTFVFVTHGIVKKNAKDTKERDRKG